MRLITIEEEYSFQAGHKAGVSGAYLTGIASIITASSKAICNLISAGINIYLTEQHSQSMEGSFKGNDGSLFN